MHLEAMMEQDWRSTWRRSIGGPPGPETRFFSYLMRTCGNVMRWLFLWGHMESWLVVVNVVGRHPGSWSYIQGSTRNRENEGKKDNLGLILYSVYAVHGVCCTWCMQTVGGNSWLCHGDIDRDDLTSCPYVMVEKEIDQNWWGKSFSETGTSETFVYESI